MSERIVWLAAVAAFTWACSNGGSGTDATADAGDEVTDMSDETDLPVETADTPVGDVVADVEEATDTIGEAPEIEEAVGPADAPDAPPVLPPLAIKPPLATPPDPLKGTGIESSAVYLEETCQAGRLRRCHVYDTTTGTFVEEPDPMLKRVLLLERWRDLYNRPDGLTSERNFNTPTPPGTPEAVWSDPARFDSHQGMGDSGIWTGWTVVGDILRYSQTGTEADYRRMEAGVRTLLAMYDVTGIPGYFIRYFYLLLPPGAPNDPAHVFRYGDPATLSHHHRPVDPAALLELPDVYTDGVTDSEGKVWKGIPMWQGRPSIDQNTGPMNALPMAYALLRDETLKRRIAYHLTCYLNRLQRIELRNLQKNQDLAASLMQFFNAGELMLDPDDMDLARHHRGLRAAPDQQGQRGHLRLVVPRAPANGALARVGCDERHLPAGPDRTGERHGHERRRAEPDRPLLNFRTFAGATRST